MKQICFTINTRPLVIDDTIVIAEKKTKHELDLSILSPVYKTIHHPDGSFRSVTKSYQHLLIHQHPNLCLFNRELSIVKQTLWPYGAISDMCWSSTSDRFIVLEVNNMFLINEDTMSIHNVYTIKEQKW
ncbi:unnamed protein product [Rotaria sp. Silwood2]|nr:unnamed protein product [Rotaria sp. Silwood2]CAF2638305.1 unnamed protein product [Rotaria sp. Silwood2]CAF2888271.1 unnamed protein product [Rotaria sp. Silwood2]CAF3033533.1 unnamed protein product [Rotaria sp. Silwood2]CAF4005282.1 unnamed protein product [Rotaria sp. Silwood2]